MIKKLILGLWLVAAGYVQDVGALDRFGHPQNERARPESAAMLVENHIGTVLDITTIGIGTKMLMGSRHNSDIPALLVVGFMKIATNLLSIVSNSGSDSFKTPPLMDTALNILAILFGLKETSMPSPASTNAATLTFLFPSIWSLYDRLLENATVNFSKKLLFLGHTTLDLMDFACGAMHMFNLDNMPYASTFKILPVFSGLLRSIFLNLETKAFSRDPGRPAATWSKIISIPGIYSAYQNLAANETLTYNPTFLFYRSIANMSARTLWLDLTEKDDDTRPASASFYFWKTLGIFTLGFLTERLFFFGPNSLLPRAIVVLP